MIPNANSDFVRLSDGLEAEGRRWLGNLVLRIRQDNLSACSGYKHRVVTFGKRLRDPLHRSACTDRVPDARPTARR